MKKDFSQPFIKSQKVVAYLLIEVENDLFLQLTELDELDAFYATTLTVDLDITIDTTLQLVEVLHANGLGLVKYRELLRETRVDYSYSSNEAGVSGDVVVLHVTTERTNGEVLHTQDQTVEFVNIEEYMRNLRATGIPLGLLEGSVSRLLLERSRL